MNNFIKICAATITSIIIYIPAVHANYFDYFKKLDYYTGFGIGSQTGGFKENYGAGFIDDNNFYSDLYFGGQKNGLFGFEIGISGVTVNNGYYKLNGGQYYPGATRPLDSGTYESYDTKYKQNNYYFGINRYLQLWHRGNLRAFGFAGLAYTNLEVELELYADDIGYLNQAERNAARDTFAAKKFVPMLKLGVEQNWSRNWGWRCTYTWMNYASLGTVKTIQYPQQPIAIKPKNASSWDIGIFVMF